eukprot:scaffold18682_cov144-Isochrysis_galbana.AAC.2
MCGAKDAWVLTVGRVFVLSRLRRQPGTGRLAVGSLACGATAGAQRAERYMHAGVHRIVTRARALPRTAWP